MFLSICTPTYNRAYTLERTYNSLKSQTSQDFEWVIIDDGSTDNTKELVDNWILEGEIDISYYFQENQGKHIALNKGVSVSKGELFTCLDSDDWFYDNATELIKENWNKVTSKKSIAGIIGLDTFEDKNLVGSKFPEGLNKSNWIDLIYKHNVQGDKAYFFVLDIIRNYEFPNVRGDKHMPPTYQLYLLSEKYDMWLINKPIKYVEYLEDGISKNIRKKYLMAPNNYLIYRNAIMDIIPKKSKKVMNAIHLNSSLYMADISVDIKGWKNKLLVKITKPIGFLLYSYLKKV